MFEKVNVPIIGIIENMSYFVCPHCSERTDIFSAGGAKARAVDLKVDLLGEIPLDVAIRQGGDEGIPVVEGQPENEQSKAFMAIAERISSSLKSKDLLKMI